MRNFDENYNVCASDNDCTDREYCNDRKCIEACTLCVNGTYCMRVFNHKATCECPKPYSGSLATGCHKHAGKMLSLRLKEQLPLVPAQIT